MKISTKTKYGIKAMYEMARMGSRTLSIKEIAEHQGLSENYLEQLIGKLKKAGLINARRGARGGYSIAKDPGEISVADIVSALEGPIIVSESCNKKRATEHCGDPECCVAKGVWEKISESVQSLLESITLEQLCQSGERMSKETTQGGRWDEKNLS